jgi:hypothetical protein
MLTFDEMIDARADHRMADRGVGADDAIVADGHARADHDIAFDMAMRADAARRIRQPRPNRSAFLAPIEAVGETCALGWTPSSNTSGG